MRRLLSQVDYDFGSFSLDTFIDWIKQRRQRELTLIGYSMPPNLYGAIIQAVNQDFIFYDKHATVVHCLHIQLHELAHLLCEHRSQVLPAELVARLLNMDTGQFDTLDRFRSIYADEIEQEAEILAGLIYEQIVRHRRLGRLICMHSSQPIMANYWHIWE